MTINLEKIRVVEVAPLKRLMNPICPSCGKRMKSMGRGKGFRCKRCGFKDPSAEKILVEVERSLKPGLYITSPRSQRHLTKPFSRYGLEKHEASYTYERIIPYSKFSNLE